MAMAVNDPMAELLAMRARGEIDAEEFKLARKYLLAEMRETDVDAETVGSKQLPQPGRQNGMRQLFWRFVYSVVIVVVGATLYNSALGTSASSNSRSSVTSDTPRAGFVTTLQEVLACESSRDYGEVGRLWKEGSREEADYHARKHCIMIPKGRRVLLIQGGFTAGLTQMQELEVVYLGSTRRLFTATGDGLFTRR